MKYLIAMFALAFIATPALAEKPASTWQVYNPELGELTVYDTEFLTSSSKIYFQGKVEDYDGTAVSPTAAPREYGQKRSDLRRARELERQGKTEEADKIRARWE